MPTAGIIVGMDEIFPGVYKSGRALYTKALVPGSIYGEEIRNGYRVWNPYRSKLAAAILNGMKRFPFNKDSNVLYLGASTGTTVSHISDIVADGCVYALEFSGISMRKLLELAKKRRNVIPLLQDARRPEDYQYLVGNVDVIYQDIAQPNQSEILIRNAQLFLKKGNYCIICIKARSIDAIENPMRIFEKEEKRLKTEFQLLEKTDLRPYDKDHCLFLLRKS